MWRNIENHNHSLVTSPVRLVTSPVSLATSLEPVSVDEDESMMAEGKLED